MGHFARRKETTVTLAGDYRRVNGSGPAALLDFGRRATVPDAEQISLRGQVLTPGAGNDYTVTLGAGTGGGTLITFGSGITLLAADALSVYAEFQ